MNNIKLFESAHIRSVWNETDGKWYFSVADVVQVLTDSANVRDYIKKMRKRETELDANWGTLCPPLELLAPDGKRRQTQCANAEGLLRIIQSIPSPKAEPFKRWLAKVGYERLEEIENPELAAKRMRELYKTKGYSDEWIEKRVRGIAIRDELTNEWQKRGVKEQREYSILTAEISRATFGMTPSEYKAFKSRAVAALTAGAIPFRVLDDHVETTSGLASICTMHLAKGLEFRAVAVMACDDEVIPLQERVESVADDSDLEEVYNTERNLLYVACTRARDRLLVTGVAPASEFLDDLLVKSEHVLRDSEK